MNRSISFTQEDIDRFWSKVDVGKPDECWIWKGQDNGRGYGKFFLRNSGGKSNTVYAHRMSWVIANSKIPEGMMLLHSCDNPSCVNPKHLSIGTQKDNMRDASDKGRIKIPMLKGEKHPNSKLKRKEVLKIKRLLKEGKQLTEIANMFSVTPTAILLIKKNENWGWLKLPSQEVDNG